VPIIAAIIFEGAIELGRRTPCVIGIVGNGRVSLAVGGGRFIILVY
jgi:hypothetical protein